MNLKHTILQVIPALDAGGAERSTLEMARAIVAAGGRALVATRGGRLEPEVEAAGAEIFRMPVHSKIPYDLWINAGRIAKLIGKEQVDLVHARSRAPAWSAYWAARRAKVPFITTYHGAYSGEGPLKRFYNSVMTRGDRIIANSRFTAEAIRKTYQIDAGRLAVVPRGVDLHEFNPGRITAGRLERLIKSWGLEQRENTFRVLLPARLTSWKGHEIAIEAAALIKQTMKPGGASGLGGNLTLVFAGGAQGTGDYEATLRAKVEERGVREMIHFVGDCADMPAAYEWADAVINPSTRPEAFGRAAIEAGAMGKPYIAADHGGARETVIDGETGYLVEPGNPEALADMIVWVHAAKEGHHSDMGEKARARISSLYSTQAMCDATLRIYQDVIDERASA